MKNTDFTKAKVFCAVLEVGFPHYIPIPILDIIDLEIVSNSDYEITVFDLTEPRSVAFTKNSYPEGEME